MTTMVRDVMSDQVITTLPDTGFRDAVRLIEENHVHALPVVGEDGHVLGMLSESDLMCKEEAAGSMPRILLPGPRQRRRQRLRALGTTVKDCMSRHPVTVGPDCSLAQAARTMRRRHVGRLPVVDADGRLVGIVTRSDLLSVYLRSDEELSAEAREALDSECGRIAGDITVTVSEGVATLTGTVPMHSSAIEAGSTLAHVIGLITVDNQLMWRSDDVEMSIAAP